MILSPTVFSILLWLVSIDGNWNLGVVQCSPSMRGSYWKLLVWKWVFQTACIPFWCSSEHHLPCALGCQCKPTFKNFADVEIYCTLLLTRPFILLKEESKQSEYLLCFRNPCQWFSIQSSRYFHFLSIFCFSMFPLSSCYFLLLKLFHIILYANCIPSHLSFYWYILAFSFCMIHSSPLQFIEELSMQP